MAAPLATVSAQSEELPYVPPGFDAGQAERHFEDPLQVPTQVQPEFPDDAVPLVLPDNAEELSLELGNLVVLGSTVYSEDELAALYEDLLGRKTALANVFRIADRITAKYRNDGYILTRAFVPEQEIADGAVTIQVIEGYINEVRIEGLQGSDLLLDAYAEKIVSSRPVSVVDLERYLLLVRDLPGVEAEAIISPAKDTPGASDLVIRIERDAIDGFVRLDNRGSKYNGPTQLWMGTGFNSIGSARERMVLTFAAAGEGLKELNYFDLGYERILDAEGRKFAFNVTSTDSDPGHTLRALNVDSQTSSLKIGISSQPIRSRTRNLSVSANLILRNSETAVFTDPLSKDQVRFVSLDALYQSADRFGGVNQFGIGLDQGLDMLNASKEGSTALSREHGQVDFTKLRLTASRLQQLRSRWSLLASLTSQASSDKLLASEEFGVGGERCVRGYDPSELTGDGGACLLLEVRYSPLSRAAESLRAYQLYGFYDYGTVRRNYPAALKKNENLSSAGVGIRLNYTKRFSGSVEVAWPETREVDDTRTIDVSDSRLFVNLTARF